jgi:hypothetical protein
MKEFVMRGQTASGLTHTINFSGHKGDYGFKLIEFEIYPSTNIGGAEFELQASLTAAKVYEDPSNPNFDNEGLIGVAMLTGFNNPVYVSSDLAGIVNDTFIITQDLILAVIDAHAGSPMPVNWQCKFMPVKLSTSEAALTNYRQFSIFDE